MDGIAEQTGDRSVRERFGDIICSFLPQMFYLFVFQVILLVLTLFSVFYLGPGTPAYVIVRVNFVIIVGSMVPTVFVLYACTRRY